MLRAFITGSPCLLGQVLNVAGDLVLNLPLSSNLLSITDRDDPFATLWSEEIESCIGAI